MRGAPGTPTEVAAAPRTRHHDLAQTPEPAGPLEEWDTTRMLIELQSHQKELESQKTALQQALELLLEEYTLLYNSAPVGYLSLGRNGQVLKSNYATANLVGKARSQIVNQSFARLVVEEDKPMFAAFLEKVFSGQDGKVTCELRLLSQKPETIFAQMEAQVSGSRQHCLVALTNVSQLRREEQKFHIMADHTYAWEFWLGTDQKFIYVSPSCKRITGYDATEFMADPDLFFRIIHPQDRAPFDRHSLETHGTRVNFEYRILHRSGTVHWIRHDGQLVIAADGKVLGLRGSNLDVTAERHLKEQLVQSIEELKNLTAELNLSEERQRRRIALALHDEVVQSLAIGNLNLDTALRKGEIADHPVLQELRSILESSMRELRELSLDLSSPILYDMGLKSAIASLGEKLAKKFGFRFVFHAECHPRATLSEELAVTVFQFCRELLVNVGKHAGSATVTVYLSQREDQLYLSIDDDGNGFELSGFSEGFGIVNIRQRVTHLGGNFKINSSVGTGTHVEISLNTKYARKHKRERFNDD
jgi:PAS domain S-box-containing protein